MNYERSCRRPRFLSSTARELGFYYHTSGRPCPARTTNDDEKPQTPLKDDCIVLAPCAADETLPSDPRLPADLFTACLTTPISEALRDFADGILIARGADWTKKPSKRACPGD